MHEYTPRPIRVCQILLLALLLSGCSGRKVEGDLPAEDSKEKKIENLTSALSRSQTRIEELDAKLSALSDKVESTRLTVDNIAGNKPLKTEAVGAAAEPSEAATGESDGKPPVKPAAKPAKKMSASDAKELLRMDSAITDFNKAMGLFKGGKYTDAELAFNHFTETYPEHVLAGSAQFYAGESYFMLGEYKLALNEYGKVVSSFSSSPRVASAMVRLAHCYENTGNATEATRTLALAHDLYEGNPSLDWSPPSHPKKSGVGQELRSGPIEPAAKGKPSAIDDQKIDQLDEEEKK